MEFKTLQELCTEIIDCPHTTPEWKTEGIPVIRNYNLQNGFIDKSKLSFVDNDTYLQRIKRGMPQVDDIIFSREAPVGSVAIMPSNFRCCLGQRLVLLKVNKSICDPHYLLYVMLSNFVKKQYKTVEKTGSIVSNFNIGDLKNLVIPYVDIAIQKRIGKMCGMLDRKIAVNNLTIENLESMAKTLYDYWFVQFDFPDANGRPYKTSGGKMEWNENLSREIPAGWEVSSLEELASYSTERISSNKLTCQNYVGMDNMIANRGGVRESEYNPPEGDMIRFKANHILLGNIRPYFKKIWLAGYDGGCNPDVLAIVANEEVIVEFLYATLSQDTFFDYDTLGAKGTKMPRGDKEHIMSYPIPWNRELAIIFGERMRTGYRIKNQLAFENAKLTALRDYLLPMLMNGQVTFRQ